ncbi:MAG: hypothetical protein SVG88_03825 [Halobacteriales archaeon]|nr:hypothetical protein [Halobacteriales archaeon]
MSTETQSAGGSNRVLIDHRSLRTTLRELLIIGVAIGWIGFWSMLALAHLQRNAIIPGLVTGVGLTLPVALSVLYRVGKRRYRR